MKHVNTDVCNQTVKEWMIIKDKTGTSRTHDEESDRMT